MGKTYYKKIMVLVGFCFLGLMSFGQSETEFYSCLDNHVDFQKSIRVKQVEFDFLQKRIESDVRKLIIENQVLNISGVLSFENLNTIINTAASLNRLDAEYDQFLTSAIEELVNVGWTQQICTLRYDEAVYKELVRTYLEDMKFPSSDDFASNVFAAQLHFQSALKTISAQEEQWLQQGIDEQGTTNPAMDQLIDNEFYWGVLNPNWDINLRSPEVELLRRTTSSEMTGKKDKPTLKEILTLIFDTFDNIKAVLNWLSKDVLSDCAGTTKAEVKNTEFIPDSMSPGLQRKISYHVVQKGIDVDLVTTSTKIAGKVRLYKKKRNGWKKDKSVSTGISYCLKEWEPCADTPFPADGGVYYHGANHQYKKSVIKEIHPHALQVGVRSSEYLTFGLFYNRNYFLSVFVLGSQAECN